MARCEPIRAAPFGVTAASDGGELWLLPGPAHMQAGWTNQSWPSHLQSGMQGGLGREKSKGRESGSQARS